MLVCGAFLIIQGQKYSKNKNIAFLEGISPAACHATVLE